MQGNRPLALASRALDPAQTKYATIEKEMLAVCFGGQRFHGYLFGKQILVQTDHKPLVTIMEKLIHKLSACMQRMRMRLQNYDLNLTHIKGSLMFLSDTLSRAHADNAENTELFDDDLNVSNVTLPVF